MGSLLFVGRGTQPLELALIVKRVACLHGGQDARLESVLCQSVLINGSAFYRFSTLFHMLRSASNGTGLHVIVFMSPSGFSPSLLIGMMPTTCGCLICPSATGSALTPLTRQCRAAEAACSVPSGGRSHLAVRLNQQDGSAVLSHWVEGWSLRSVG